MIAIGIFLTLLVFYPGVMTYDAKFVYEDIAKGTRGDWQSPVMTVLWSLVDPIAPGSASMFLLIAAFYWLGFGLLAFTIGRRSVWLAVALLLLALSPPAFAFVGIIWRDVLLATAWLLSAALTFATADRNVKLRAPTMVVALGLVALGVLIRPNALIAAPILAGYVVWPDRFSWQRAAIVFVPAAIGFFALVQVVYYGALGATRQHPLQSIMVFDLGGISHFTKQNQYPVTWTEAETQLLINDCYRPTEWDLYWRLEPCEFVMHRLEGDKIFGTPVITDAWLHAVTRHPLAYLEHRGAFMWNFLANENLTMWTADIDHPSKTVFADRPAFNALVTIHNMLKPTPLFRAGLLAARLHRGVRVCLAAAQHAFGRICHRGLRIGRRLCADVLCRRRRVGFPLRLLGGTREHRWRRGTRTRSARARVTPQNAQTSMNCALASCVKRPPNLESSSNEPDSTIRPSSNTRMRVALRIVARRWAMTNVVRFFMTSSSATSNLDSVAASSALVASSRIRIGGSFSSARAIDRRWRSPPDSERPRSPTLASNPSGLYSIKSSACARAAASRI